MTPWLTVIPNRLCARVEWKPQDCWVGAYWKTGNVTTDGGPAPFITDVWVCLVPMLPLHLQWFHRVTIDFVRDSRDYQ